MSFPHLIIHLLTNDLVSTVNSNSVSSFPMRNCCGLATTVAPFCHEVLPRSQWIALFHRAGSPRERNLIGTRVPFSKKSQRVAPIDHTSKCQFSTLEKTKLGYHPTLSIVLRKSFHKIVHDNSPARFLGRCPQRVAPFAPLSLLSHFRDFDFHSFSSPGSLTSRMICSRAPFQ